MGIYEGGIDYADLPQTDSSEDENWLHRLRAEESGDLVESQWPEGGEEEKACLDRALSFTARTRTQERFNKVYGVGNQGFICIPKSYIPNKRSPSVFLKKDPFILTTCAQSTFRMAIKFKEKATSSEKSFLATGFALSPTIGVTAGHCVGKNGMDLSSIEGCGGSMVYTEMFNAGTGSGWDGELIEVKNCWSKDKDKDGLYLGGADFGLFRNKSAFPAFLLPCSPTFISETNVAVVSYPGVDSFLKEAEEELINKYEQSGHIWCMYAPAMSKVLEEAVKEAAIAKAMSVEDFQSKDALMKGVLQQVKGELLESLKKTFGKFSTGALVCSVGEIPVLNACCFGTTFSTLRGSSGAAVILLVVPGHFVGVHSGGSAGFDLNSATSTDNPEFVIPYLTHVLPTLPHPKDDYWFGVNLEGFVHWLKKHLHDTGSPWYKVASQGGVKKRKLGEGYDEDILSCVSFECVPAVSPISTSDPTTPLS